MTDWKQHFMKLLQGTENKLEKDSKDENSKDEIGEKQELQDS